MNRVYKMVKTSSFEGRLGAYKAISTEAPQYCCGLTEIIPGCLFGDWVSRTCPISRPHLMKGTSSRVQQVLGPPCSVGSGEQDSL